MSSLVCHRIAPPVTFVSHMLVIGTLVSAPAALANGIHRYDFASSYMSTAGVGQTTDTGASAAFNNPAGLGYLAQPELDVRLLLVEDSMNYYDEGSTDNTGGAIPGWDQRRRNVDYGTGTSLGGSLFYAHPVNDRLSIGFSFASTAGGSSDFGDNWVGENYITKIDVNVLTANLALGYQLNEQWAIGAAAGVGYMTWELDFQAPMQVDTPNGPILASAPANLDLDDTQPVWSVGVMYKPEQGTTLGLRYVNSVDFDLDGDFTVTTPMGVQKDQARHTFNLPNMVTFGVEHSLTPELRLLAELEWSEWSRFNETKLAFDNNPQDTVIDRSYRDIWGYGIGISYDAMPSLTLSAGIAYDESPVSGEHAKLDPPVDRQVSYAAGADYRLSKHAGISLSYLYLDLGDIRVSQDLPNPEMPFMTINGHSEAHCHLVNLGYTHRF